MLLEEGFPKARDFLMFPEGDQCSRDEEHDIVPRPGDSPCHAVHPRCSPLSLSFAWWVTGMIG